MSTEVSLDQRSQLASDIGESSSVADTNIVITLPGALLRSQLIEDMGVNAQESVVALEQSE